jgi:hypothetical protein
MSAGEDAPQQATADQGLQQQRDIVMQLKDDGPLPTGGRPIDLAPVGIVDHPPKIDVAAPKDGGDAPHNGPPPRKRKCGAVPRPFDIDAGKPPLRGSDGEDRDGDGADSEEPSSKGACTAGCVHDDDDDDDDDGDGDGKKKNEKQKRKRAPKKGGGSSAQQLIRARKQPGFAMIKAEEERLRRAVEVLERKKQQRERANNGKSVTSTCGVLINDLLDFYDDTLEIFEHKFARYIN